MKLFRRFAYAELRGAILSLRRNYGICEADGCSRTPPGAMLRRPFRYRRSLMYICGRTCYKLYSGKRCILGERKRLGGETVGLHYPVWLLRNIDSDVKTRVTTNVCLLVPTFCYETQHNQSLYTSSDRV